MIGAGVWGVRREVDEVRTRPCWEGFRSQLDSLAVDVVGPKEVVRTFRMKISVISEKGIGDVVASGSSIKNYGKRRSSGTRSQVKE